MGQPCQAEDLGIFLYPESISVDVDSDDIWIRNVVFSGMTSELLRELRGVPTIPFPLVSFKCRVLGNEQAT